MSKPTHFKVKPVPRYQVADSRKIDGSVFVYDTHWTDPKTGGQLHYRITHDIPAIPARLAVAKHIARQLNINWEENGIAAKVLQQA